MKKKIITGLMIALVFTALFVVTIAAGDDFELVNVKIDGQEFESGNTVLKNSLTYVPLAPFCEAMGDCNVSLNEEKDIATVIAEKLEIIVPRGYKYIRANGVYLYSASENYTDENDNMYVPIRALATAYGAEVSWDNDNFCANITTVNTSEPEGPFVDVEIAGVIFEQGNTVLKDSLTYVPLNAFCQAMGECEISWDTATNTEAIKADGLELFVKVGTDYMCANGVYIYSTGENYIERNGKIYVPIRSIARVYGADVSWDNERFCAVISAPTAPIEPGTQFVNVRVDNNVFEPYNTVLKNSLTYVPLRAFCDIMGECQISWDNATNTAIINAPGLTVTVKEGDGYICANGRYLFSNSENYVGSDDKMYVPVRAMATAYGAEVSWDNEHFCANIGRATTPIQSGDTFYNSDDLYWLSHIINAESGNEPLIGQIAVGNVIFNRLRQDSGLNSIYDVIWDRRYGVQFQPTASGTIYLTPGKDSIIAAKICLEGYSLSDRIIYFFDPSLATNFWMAYNCTYVMTIGSHEFYC